jgi:hypothetical protein
MARLLTGQETGFSEPERLVLSMYQMAVSGTFSEVRVEGVHGTQTGDQGSAPSLTVLVLGWGGSGVDELGPIAKFYADAGAAVVLTTPVGQLGELQEQQEAQVVAALEATLLTDGMPQGKLLVHICSNNGFAAWARWKRAWLQGADTSGPSHFASLAARCPLRSVLKGYVYDCCPDERCDEDFLRMVLMGCLGALAIRFSLPAIWGWIDSGEYDTGARSGNAVLKRASRLLTSKSLNQRSQEGPFEEEHDLPVPRLFVYSMRDNIVRPENVEKHIQMLQEQKEVPKIRCVKVQESGHNQIFWKEPALYFQGIQTFLQDLRIRLEPEFTEEKYFGA